MNLHLSTFEFDASPPLGHSCCGGWITPVVAIDDPLMAKGIVLLGAGAPIVIMAVDWTGILNSSHREFREAIADAAHTTPERVAIQCVHQHDAPFDCVDSQAIVAAQGDLPHIVMVDYHKRCVENAAKAVKESLKKARPVTGFAAGKGKVEKVAANRRIAVDPETNKIRAMRGSSCRNPELIALPEGTIDPWLRTAAFYSGKEKIAALHYYATHPMSYYGQGRVDTDFVGMARQKRQAEEPGCHHIYFTGASGNIGAGKYNDGSPEMRPILAERIYQGIVASEANLDPQPIESASWGTYEFLPPANESFDEDALVATISNHDNRVVQRNRPSFMLAWLRRTLADQFPIVMSSLHLNDVTLLHLPAESFVEYQLRGQKLAGPDRFVCTAAYGDGGTWYIPTKEEYPKGGYEVSVAFSSPKIDDLMTAGITKLVKPEGA